MKNKFIKTAISVFCIMLMAGGVYAAISETVKITGTTFNVGTTFGGGSGGPSETNTMLKMYTDLSGSNADSNLADSVSGPVYNDVNDTWSNDYAVKIYNKGSTNMTLVAKADYIDDPNTLRDDIYVTIIEWNDSNSDGIVDTSELGATYGNDTILRLRNDTFALGSISAGETRGFVYRFDGSGLSEANASQSAIYDFTIIGDAL